MPETNPTAAVALEMAQKVADEVYDKSRAVSKPIIAAAILTAQANLLEEFATDHCEDCGGTGEVEFKVHLGTSTHVCRACWGMPQRLYALEAAKRKLESL